MKKLNNIQSAVGLNGGHSRLSLDQPMITSAKIGQIFPIYHEALIPGDHVKVNTSVFSRFAPLAVPSYVRLNLRTMTLFVPYHQLADGCESFFSNQSKFHGKDNHIPILKFSTLSGFFESVGMSVATGATAASHDLAFLSKSGSASYRNLTPKGNYIIKILRGLGYAAGKQMFANGELSDMRSDYDWDMNALPLLAFCHGYNSYMSYSPLTNSSALSSKLEDIKRQSSANGYALTTTDLNVLLSDILLTYDDNLFTMAWANPYGNQTSGFRDVGENTVTSPNYSLNVAFNPAYGSAANTGASAMTGQFTAAQLRLVMKFDDFFRRSMYAGSKDIEQIYSRLGVKIDDFRCRYPYFLRETTQPVSIGDVTSTSDTVVPAGVGAVTGGALGSYAGKAISDGGTGFEFDCHDYGMLITYAWYAPVVQYYNGFDKEVLRTNPLDFYQPEFDQGFADSLLNIELRGSDMWVGDDGNVPVTANRGYVPLYSQYLFGRQYITGDFRRFSSFEAWHFGRDVLTNSLPAQNAALVYMPNIGTEYERIFNIADPELADADTIYIDVYNSVKASRPMKDYTGKVGLGDGDIDVGLNGSQLN